MKFQYKETQIKNLPTIMWLFASKREAAATRTALILPVFAQVAGQQPDHDAAC
jgi:hypothetical protein